MKHNTFFLMAVNALWLLCGGTAVAANNVETVTQITQERTIITPVDLRITASTAALTAMVNIANDDAVIIFEDIKPSDVIANYASYIKINGAAFSLNSNVMVSIYKHGSIVIPRGKSYNPLTVYTEANYGGETSNQYVTNTYYNSLGNFNNAIRSFKLKRGYMVTMATSANGKGYSRVFIAHDDDLEVPVLQSELAGKVSFFRIFRWQWPNKKGYSGGNEIDNALLNTTWYYTWGAGEDSRTDREFCPQRHHESGKSYSGNTSHGAWPSWSEINARNETCTHLLGQNEPDNTSAEAEVYMKVDELLEHQTSFLSSGMRIGTFAPCNPSSWVTDFVAKTKARNLRVDFVVVHWYKGGQNPANFINDLKWMHEATGLPVWITEWNNGANWTTESGFPLADGTWQGWTGNLTTDRARHALWMRDVLKLLNDAPFVERYAIYNAVESKRYVVDNHTLTPAGQIYAEAKPNFAFNPSYGAIMQWNRNSPTDFVRTYAPSTQAVTLTWSNANGEQTDSTYIERRFNGGDFEIIEKLDRSEAENYSYRDVLKELSNGLYEYRIRNHDSDGKARTTNTLAVTKGGAEGDLSFQYGSMSLLNTEYTYVTFQQEDDVENPVVIVSPTSFNNTSLAPTEHLANITKGQFRFRYFPWTLSSEQTFSAAESSNYMIVPKGNYSYGEMKMEVSTAGRVGNDTVEVYFNEPFDEGVTPVVLANVTSTWNTYPFMLKIWDVTSTGFKTKLMRQEGLTFAAFPSQVVNYMAVSPGRASMGNGKQITAGRSTTKIGGKVRQRIYFQDDNNLHYTYASEPLLFAQLQTNHIDAAHILRMNAPTLSGETLSTYILRQVDTSSSVATNSAAVNGDYVGWLTVNDDPTGVESSPADDPHFHVSVENRVIRVHATQPYTIYSLSGQQQFADATLAPGLYLIRCGKKTIKVTVH